MTVPAGPGRRVGWLRNFRYVQRFRERDLYNCDFASDRLVIILKPRSYPADSSHWHLSSVDIFVIFLDI